MKIRSDDIKCDMCGLDMKVKERLESKKPYRIRRFICICGYEKTIFADGTFDEKIIPRISLDSVNSMYKKQERNNEE